VNNTLKDSIDSIWMSFAFFGAELLLVSAFLFIIVCGLLWKNKKNLFHLTTFAFLAATTVVEIVHVSENTEVIFNGIFRTGSSFADYFKILFSISGLLTVIMTWRNEQEQRRLSEFYALLISVILGANMLVMSENLLVVFLSLELISIGSYLLTGFGFNKNASEGSLKYFVFGSIASAVMLYGFTLLYGIFGTLSFATFEAPPIEKLSMLFIAAIFSLAGFLYKIAAAPMHPWAPDVYEAAPMPVVAFFSVVPKLAGMGILLKFVTVTSSIGINWQVILAGIAIFTLTVGNFSALWQKNVKRLMAYSSIGQSGFLLIGVVSCTIRGAEFLLFYATVYLILTYLIFIYLQYFENRGFTTIASFEGSGKEFIWASVFMVIGFIGLTGLPPTAGFTGKLFLFSALWECYSTTGSQILLWLMIFGLLNTAVSLFYYLRIPFYAFIRSKNTAAVQQNKPAFENLLALILVLLILILFFSPQLLMGWINKSNFVF
jgi:NADH-quinone oxidoreductase subunit N